MATVGSIWLNHETRPLRREARSPAPVPPDRGAPEPEAGGPRAAPLAARGDPRARAARGATGPAALHAGQGGIPADRRRPAPVRLDPGDLRRAAERARRAARGCAVHRD